MRHFRRVDNIDCHIEIVLWFKIDFNVLGTDDRWVLSLTNL